MLLLLLVTLTARAAAAQPEATPALSRRVLEVFVRDGCPHCADAKIFLAQLARDRPDVQIVYRPVDQDERALEDLVQRSRDAGMWPPGVPTFVANGRLLVGFDDAERSGPAVLALLDPAGPPADEVDSAVFGALSASRLGLPLFTLALGLSTDSIPAPCGSCCSCSRCWCGCRTARGWRWSPAPSCW